MRCEPETRDGLVELMKRDVGVSCEEALQAFPMEMSDEDAMRIAQFAVMRQLLHMLGGWSVRPDALGDGQRAYRLEASMTPKELRQVMKFQSQTEFRAAQKKEDLIKQIRKLQDELRAAQKHLFPKELDATIKALERTVQPMGAP